MMKLWEKVAVTSGIIVSLTAGAMVAHNNFNPGHSPSSDVTISQKDSTSVSKARKHSSQTKATDQSSQAKASQKISSMTQAQTSSQVSSAKVTNAPASQSSAQRVVSSSQAFGTNQVVTKPGQPTSSAVSSQKATANSSSVAQPATLDNQARLVSLNQAVTQKLGNVALIRTLTMPADKPLNVSVSGNANEYTVSYGLGSVASELNTSTDVLELASLNVVTYASESEAQSTLQGSVVDATGLPTEQIAGQTVSVDAGAGQRYYLWQNDNWHGVVHTSVVDGSDANAADKIQALDNVAKPQTSLGVADYLSNGAKLSWVSGNQINTVTASSMAQASQAAMSVK